MNKHLKLNGRFLCNFADFLTGKLTGKDNSGKAEVGKLFYTVKVVHRHLRGCVKRKVRCNLTKKPCYAEVRNDYGICTCTVDFTADLLNPCHFTVTGKGVYRNINLHSALVAKLTSGAEVFIIKIFCKSPGIELTIAEIHRIGTVCNCGAEGIKRACRGENFCPILHITFRQDVKSHA